jgi:NAD(P)-dependent dehydrogenase (short-subunit alcohol dehydrogenase family)
MHQEYVFITGGASGIGYQIAKFLTDKGLKIFIADLNEVLLESTAKELGASCGVMDVTSWESQVKVFSKAVAEFGRIDYVYPVAGIGERTWLPPTVMAQFGPNYSRPDLRVLDVNIAGLIYTVSLAVQQFRRQELGPSGYKGKSKC